MIGFRRISHHALRARLAALTGALALGLVAVLFARAGEAAQALFDATLAHAPYATLIVTPIAFALITGATRRWFAEARGSGIPQVMAAASGHDPDAQARGPLLSLRNAVVKIAGTLGMLLAGGAVGREGPTVQVSAAIMGACHRWLRVPATSGVIIAGGAAGVAAAFNTPLAGVAFAIEELAAAFEQKLALNVMLAVLVSGLVSLSLAGDYVYFGAMAQSLPIGAAIGAALLAGVAGGLAGGAFSRLLIAFAEAQHPAIAAIKRRPVLFAAGCGLVVAAVGVASHGLTWGTGYGATRKLLEGGTQSGWFGPARFVATVATAVSGAPGGIFAPSLSVGAGLGQMLTPLFPGDSSGAIVMLGMIAYFAGVTRAPLTAVIIVMEMTANRAMILPLFGAAIVADAVSAWVCPEKLYHALSRPFRTRG
ncbi:chloride channel protein [Novosphingobium olei]|uniref:chloride channel protein n=1 Tax=Novosphingobium olei TaxID=2728851 RepID=UPI00308C4A7C|nr:chloride channel protein [Novosphingobium olei]